MKTTNLSCDSKNSRRRPLPATSLIVLLAILAFAGCQRRANDPNAPIRVSGNIEVVDVRMAFKQPGRLIERAVDEGAAVTKGMLISRLDDAELRHEVDLRKAELKAARAKLDELEAGSRPQEIAAAEAALASAKAEQQRTRLEFERQKELRATDAAAARELEQAEAQLRVAEARVAETAEKLALVREGPREEQIAQARARVGQARAALALSNTRLSDTEIFAPFDGVVLQKHAEPGEFLMAGAPVVTVADTANVWLRAYVNQTDLGRIRLGQDVEVFTDSFPDKTYRGTLSFISSEAEFTPKTVQTTKERVTLVFRIKVDLDNSSGELKPGMAADADLKPTAAE